MTFYDNIVFTDLSTASFLLYGTEGTTNVQYGDFYVNDPDELERIMTDVQELDGVDWGELHPDPLRQRLSER